jgi:organic hydroperoxide reductase OsmC/OhrA
MSTYTANVSWSRSDEKFTDNRYSRVHRWKFDGGIEVRASSSPHHVALPMSSAEAVDPEEAFVASLSSCHMLWFLALAAKAGYTVDAYEDEAIGTMAQNADQRLAITEVKLRPHVLFSGTKQPTLVELDRLHHEAHERCFLANSVKSNISIELRHSTL